MGAGQFDASDMALIAMAYLLAKHAIADFVLQTAYQWRNKGRYGHPGGILHAAIHAAMSAPVLAILPPPALAAGGWLLLGEFVLHYHVDWLKETFGWLFRIKPNSQAFWSAIGIDQLAHGWTYCAMVWLLIEPDRLARLIADIGRLVAWFGV